MKNIYYIESYRDYLLEEEKSQSTIEGYTSDIKDFITFLGKEYKENKKE